MRAKLIVFALFALFALFAFGARAAFACSCVVPGFAKRYELTDNVFTAVVIDQQIIPAGDHLTVVQHHFEVSRVFKGDQPFDVLVREQSDVVVCGIPPELGVEYLFFVQNSGRLGACGDPVKTELAGPEIAALDSFASGKRPELAEPWSFSSHDEGCSLRTRFDLVDDGGPGSLELLGRRPGRPSPDFGRAKVNVFPDTDNLPSEVVLMVDGTTYKPARVFPMYSQTGDEADELLRKTLLADGLRLHLEADGAAVEISTANLADAGTGAKMLECIGPR